MLAQLGADLHVVVIQRHDAVDGALAHQIGDGVRDVGLARQVGQRQHEELVDGVARPILVFELLRRHQDRVAALALALFEKWPALEVAGKTEDGWHSGRNRD
jgi:hypothetical protein